MATPCFGGASPFFIHPVQPSGQRTVRPSPTQGIMARRPLIEYYKEILDRISFADKRTFRKELRKAFRSLTPEDREELKRWFRSSCICRVPLRADLRTIPIELEQRARLNRR